jgi:glycosyltransferase involved in cell wall biosynthesis
MRSPDELSVALAHHWMVSMRGGEKTIAELAGLFPAAPLYTLLARTETLDPRLLDRPLHVSWLQGFARIRDLQRYALPLLPAAARSLNASAHDVVICSDAAIIKAIRTRPAAMKICYCHAPMRYVWDLYDDYYAGAGLAGRLGLRLFADRVRRADRAAADSVTLFVANSRNVAERIRRSYGRPCAVIHPPVDTDVHADNAESVQPPTESGVYLVVGELVHYKRPDLAVEACTRLGKKLVVIGTGPLLERLRESAGPSVQVLGWRDDRTVRDYMRRCRALLFCGAEDFGLVPVEVQAAGRPVIAYAAGGALETVLDGHTGMFFREQTVEDVTAAIERFEAAPLWPADQIAQHAQQFSIARFRERFMDFYLQACSLYLQGGVDAVRDSDALLSAFSGERQP